MLRLSRVCFLILLGLLLAVYLWHMRILDYDISRMRAYFIPRASTVLEQTELLFEPHNVALRVRRAGNGVREVPHTSLGCDSPAETLKQAKAEGHRPTHPACDQVWENPYANEEGWIMLHIELQRYQIFHRQQLNCLKHELYYGDGSLCNTPVLTLTWVCNDAKQCSGIGDQMAQIQMTFLLAMATERVFLIYWDPAETSRTMQHLLPHTIDWRYPDMLHTNNNSVVKESVNITGNRQSFTRKQYTVLLSRLQKQSVKHITVSHQFRAPFKTAYRDAGRIVRESLGSLGVPMILSGGAPVTYLQGTILRYLFVFDSGVMSSVGRLKKTLGLFPEPYAALHLRTGFFGSIGEEKGNFNSRKILKDKQQWADMIECALNETDALLGPTTPLYLATDSYAVKQWAVETYGCRVRTANLTLEHVAQKQSLQGQEESRAPWIDFLLLAHSQLLARGLSGFSTVAGSFCSLPVSRQVCLPTIPTGDTALAYDTSIA